MNVDLWAFVLQRSKVRNLTVNGWITKMVEMERERQATKADAIGLAPQAAKPGSRLKK